MENLQFFSGQEGLNSSGKAGRALGEPRLVTLDSLGPGEKAMLFGKMTISGSEAAGSNFEQTHLTVYGDHGEAGRELLVDEPQANIVDPPRSN
jgi:hypothetical protein